jgi:hypothetical protein
MAKMRVLQFPDRRLFDKHQDQCNGSSETVKAVNATEVHLASFVSSSGCELKRGEIDEQGNGETLACFVALSPIRVGAQFTCG